MADSIEILVISDIHYASEPEKARGQSEFNAIKNPFLLGLTRAFRHFIWLRDPLAHNHRLHQALNQAKDISMAIGVGDYSVDSVFVGASDDGAMASIQECLGLLRRQFGSHFFGIYGDHELGKMSLFGGKGGPRIASWSRLQEEARLLPFWRLDLGAYRLIGVTSTVIALPVFEPETLPDERAQWRSIRAEHLDQIRQAFASLHSSQRVILFCHDPTALPFLWREPAIQTRLGQMEQTFIGHLHSNLIFYKSRILAGMPPIRFLGNSIRRMSAALYEARLWRPFKVRLCPSLAGIQLTKGGGFYRVVLDLAAKTAPKYKRIYLDH
jgi:hypothetical protein